MMLITRAGDRTYSLLQAAANELPAVVFETRYFPCLLWDLAEHRPESELQGVVSSLLSSGSRYLVCGGISCSAWERVADDVAIARFSEDAEVMTTAHRGQTENEVARFFVFNTNFGVHDFKEYLVLVLGETGDGIVEQLCASIRRYALEAAGLPTNLNERG
jgi:hypothetical protein